MDFSTTLTEMANVTRRDCYLGSSSFVAVMACF